MKVWIFQADLFCDDCMQQYMQDRTPPSHVNTEEESSYDSDDWPKGPYCDGGGEADSPQHCACCSVFLRNPLTSEGVNYVRAMLESREKALREAGLNEGENSLFGAYREFYGIK